MLIDSNILIYAINISSPKSKVAGQFLKNNEKQLVIAHQNIFEAIRVLTHPKFGQSVTSKDAIKSVMSIASSSKVITPNFKTHFLALELIERHNLTANKVFDAYLAATALSNEIDTIVTDNVKDFQKFPIKIINPFS